MEDINEDRRPGARPLRDAPRRAQRHGRQHLADLRVRRLRPADGLFVNRVADATDGPRWPATSADDRHPRRAAGGWSPGGGLATTGDGTLTVFDGPGRGVPHPAAGLGDHCARSAESGPGPHPGARPARRRRRRDRRPHRRPRDGRRRPRRGPGLRTVRRPGRLRHRPGGPRPSDLPLRGRHDADGRCTISPMSKEPVGEDTTTGDVTTGRHLVRHLRVAAGQPVAAPPAPAVPGGGPARLGRRAPRAAGRPGHQGGQRDRPGRGPAARQGACSTG